MCFEISLGEGVECAQPVLISRLDFLPLWLVDVVVAYLLEIVSASHLGEPTLC